MSNSWISRFLIGAMVIAVGATGCVAEEGPGSTVVITQRDLDVLPAGQALHVATDGNTYRFDASRGAIAFDRVVLDQSGIVLDDSLRAAGLDATQVDRMELAGFTLAFGAGEPPPSNVHGEIKRAGRCLDWKYYIIPWVYDDGSVLDFKVWFCDDYQ